MQAVRISLLDHRDTATAERIWTVQRLAYAQEAALLQVTSFEPLERGPAHIVASPERFLGAMLDAELVGAISFGPDDEPDQVNIASLVVHPAHQRRGVGSLLLAAVLNECAGPVVTVSTSAKNRPALSLYQRFGFVECCRWTVGADALELVTLRRD